MTRVVYFGNERLVSGLEKTDAPILRGLIDQGYDVVAVVSHYSDSKSRNNRDLEVATIANEHSIPLLLPARPSEIIDELRALDADVAVLAAYGRIIGQQVIDLFPLGIINVHPSLLPQYRGPTPIESAILNGDSQTGISIMQLTAGMDEGPVYAQSVIPLIGSESKFELYEKIVSQSTPLFFDTFRKIVDENLQPQPQDDSKATYSKLIEKDNGTIDWTKPAHILDREIRAYSGWPASRTTLKSLEVIITEAHVTPSTLEPGSIESTKSSLTIGTSDGSLAIDAIKPLGKKEMPIGAFLAGYRSQIV